MNNSGIRILFILFFVMLNVSILFSYSDLTHGGRNFNGLAKYLMLTDKVISLSTVMGLIISIVIGSNVIGDDISSGKMHIMISSFPKRWKYICGCLNAILIMSVTFVLLIIINYLLVAFTLNLNINYNDFFSCMGRILFNNVVMISITSMVSILINSTYSLIIGLASMILFNIYAFGKVPIINLFLDLDFKLKKILACFAPFNTVYIEGSYMDGTIVRNSAITPIITDNMILYQFCFILILLLFDTVLFKHKQL